MEGGLAFMYWVPALASLVIVAVVVIELLRTKARLGKVSEERDRYLQVFEQANDGVFVLDLASGAIRSANARAASMLGYTMAEFRSKTIFDLHFKQDLDKSALRIADAWGNDGLIYEDLPFCTAQGAELHVECSVRVTAFNGGPAVLFFARDITERVRLRQEVDLKNAEVERHNQEMRSGLRYAQGIQMGMLPSLGQLRGSFADAFAFCRPRDIVSGDFYWSARVGRKVVVAVADCTGHGVPGALLSMTGIGLLQQVVTGRGILAPAAALTELRSELMRALAHQDGEGPVRDGMNIGMICYDTVSRECEFSGALCPLYILRAKNGEMEEIKGDRMPVGFQEGTLRPFTPHLFYLSAGDRLYMASDGFADQFGGPLGKKMKTSGLKELLSATGQRSTCSQGHALEQAFTAWMGTHEQVDDVLLVGLQA
jgi:PAS domain S-box-containing protein